MSQLHVGGRQHREVRVVLVEDDAVLDHLGTACRRRAGSYRLGRHRLRQAGAQRLAGGQGLQRDRDACRR